MIRSIAGQTVHVNEEGFLTASEEWTREIAEEIAEKRGLQN